MARVTFDDKEDTTVQPGLRKNLVIADDINQLKNGINGVYDMLANLRQRIVVPLSASDFSGSNYQNSNLVALVPMSDFTLCTNDGSGVLLNTSGGYTFNGTTGTITAAAGNYVLTIFKPLS